MHLKLWSHLPGVLLCWFHCAAYINFLLLFWCMHQGMSYSVKLILCQMLYWFHVLGDFFYLSIDSMSPGDIWHLWLGNGWLPDGTKPFLKKCWLIMNKIMRHSLEDNLTENAQNHFQNYGHIFQGLLCCPYKLPIAVLLQAYRLGASYSKDLFLNVSRQKHYTKRTHHFDVWPDTSLL